MSGQNKDEDFWNFIFNNTECINDLGCYLLATINACDDLFLEKDEIFRNLYIRTLFNEIYTKLYYNLNSEINKRYYNDKIDNLVEEKETTPFSKEQIKILKYRKMGYRLEEIGQQLSPALKKSHMLQKSMVIRNQLGAKNIDEAVRLFESTYFVL